MNLNEYILNRKVLFARIIDLPDYQSTEEDIKKIMEENIGSSYNGIHEIENFLIREDNKVYGFVEVGSIGDKEKKINIEQFNTEKTTGDYIDNCLIIFTSLKTSKVIGFYKNARIYKERQYLSNEYIKKEELAKIEGLNYDVESKISYFFEATADDVFLFREDVRISIDKLREDGLNYGQSNIKYIDNQNYEYAKEIVNNISMKYHEEKDLYNFHKMLKFWIKQTDNNITKKGLVPNKEISVKNSLDCVKKYKSPQFYPEYLTFNDFNIIISFFRTGQYKGEKVNFIVADIDDEIGNWITIRYQFDKQKIILSYDGDAERNNAPQNYKEYMRSNKFLEVYEIDISKLNLESNSPNYYTKELFEYFRNMIISTKNYLARGNNNMKIIEVKEHLLKNKNIILRGAPGTGKTYLARQVASEIIGIPVEDLNNSKQYAFVQFHPSYDYTDFVEGLRPITINGNPSFYIQKGIFMSFCETARKNSMNILSAKDGVNNLTMQGYEAYLKQTVSNNALYDYTRYINFILGKQKYTGNKNPAIPQFDTLESILMNKEIIKKFDIDNNYGNYFITPISHLEKYAENENRKIGNFIHEKKYVFVIDEINRGEISRIFGELFFSIDPDYRGKSGSVYTQYSNLHDNNDKFYVPENVYIIGTMNDIDRSVDTFDFAMRRRFSFIEITAEYSQTMLKNEEVKDRMIRLNSAIVDREIGQLSMDYQIGGSYFKQLDEGIITEEELWKTKLYPLLKDYYRGDINAEEKIEKIKKYYDNEDGFDYETDFEG